MTSTALKPDIHGLQKDVVDLLERVSQLMGRASSQLWSKDGFEAKYATYRDQIAEEARKVRNLELRMAIAAPMKAGKSTIINAIIGQELLPSRNAAMTTLPTEIVLKRDLQEPVLELGSETISTFQHAWLILNREIEKLGPEELHEKIGQYPHLLELVAEIRGSIGFPIRSKTVGCQEVNKALSELNDIIRLCSQLAPLADPLRALSHVPRIETPFWQLQVDAPVETFGNLVIVDTPGPNEAGENLRLVGVVEEQLQKSSLVLIVLDYMQLKTKAAEEVKEDVQKVIKIRGKENLYVLVNKVDQRRDKDMTAEEVKQFVSAEFDLDMFLLEERVFEISARKACAASSFKQEMEMNPGTVLHEMKTARVLAQEIFAVDWEEELADSDVELLVRKADRLWKTSGFSPFLNKAISKLMAEAAPRCMQVALVIAQAHLAELLDAVKLRKSAISQDAAKLKTEVMKLRKDVEALRECRARLQEKATAKKNKLAKKLQLILQEMKSKSAMALEEYFLEGLSQRLNGFQKLDLEGRKLFTQPIKIPIISDLIDFIIPSSLSSLLKYQVAFAGLNSIKFNKRSEAEDFVGQVFLEAKQIIETLLYKEFIKIQNAIREVQGELRYLLRKDTKPIIERARNRLNEEFDVELSLPKLLLIKDVEIGSTDLNINILKKEKDFFEAVVSWLQSLFGHRAPDEEFYTVSLEDIVKQVNSAIEKKVEETEEKISEYLELDFQETTDQFFSSLDAYLQNYQDSLIQALNDQSSSMEDQDILKHLLDFYAQDSNSLLDELQKKLSFVDTLIPSTKFITASK